jgi:hypothetical protein
MIAQELTFLKAQEVFQRISGFLSQAIRDGLRMDEIERQLKTDLAEAGLAFLEEFVESCGVGDEGETVAIEGRLLRRSETPEPRRYLSIFGELSISRYVYAAGKKKAIEYAPLDAQLGLPAGEISYVLEDFQQRLCVQSPYEKSTEDLKVILGTGVPVGTAEHMTQQMGPFAQGYRLSALTDEGMPPPKDEAELLVVAGDGKGVVMRKTLAERLKEEQAGTTADTSTDVAAEPPEAAASQPKPSPASCSEASCSEAARAGEDVSRKRQRRAARKERQRRHHDLARRQRAQKGSRKETAKQRVEKTKKNRKQMAYVGAAYTIARFVRTPDQILDEVARRERAKDRPRPQSKHVWGEMTQLQEGELLDGRSSLFLHLAVECHLRDPNHRKVLICLMDGEEPLWSAKREWLDRAVEILDIFHVLERLWRMAHSLPKGSNAKDFVEHHARMILEGKVDYAIRNFRHLMKQRKLRGKAKAEMERGIGYFRKNRHRMRYDEYLAQGYPIGSGVAEGTCRNLVKDRMELTGMRWEQLGAQAMIYLRAMYLNDEWDTFIKYRIEKEQNKLYGQGTAYSKIATYAQSL